MTDLSSYTYTHQHGVFYLFPRGVTDCAAVPVGALFGVVYPPSSNVTSPGFGRWRYFVFEVVCHQARGVDFSPCRYYREREKRELTAAERGHFERLSQEAA